MRRPPICRSFLLSRQRLAPTYSKLGATDYRLGPRYGLSPIVSAKVRHDHAFPPRRLSVADRRRRCGEICRIRMRRRLLWQHRYADRAASANDYGGRVRGPDPSGIMAFRSGTHPDEAQLKTPKWMMTCLPPSDPGFGTIVADNWFSGSDL